MLAVFGAVFAAVASSAPPSSCPVTNSTKIVYSTATGVGGASKIWVADLLKWWASADPTLEYTALTAAETQSCDLASYPNLRVFMNPGGDAYSQLGSLGKAGTEQIKKFVGRDQKNPSAYAGFCAGGYMAATSYLWETMYEGPGYFDFATNPPMGFFPHMVEGSIVDANDDQFGNQHGSKFRKVNMRFAALACPTSVTCSRPSI